MSTALVVARPGICTTVQDFGRVGYRASGVPQSGALDAVMLKLANLLAGNAPGEGALEMLYAGATLDVRGGSVRVALAGAEATIESAGVARALPPWQSARIEPGERLRVGHVGDTAAAYLAVEGGFDIAPALASVSTYVRGALGGWQGRALRAGDALPLRQHRASTRAERRLPRPPPLRAPATLRVSLGPHENRFERSAIESFLAGEFAVTPQSDRSGLRLEGPALRHTNGYDLRSEGVVPGSIQVPGSGQPVILIADHPTVGGYPRIATIVSADLAAAGRLRIGSRVRFIAIDADTARRARVEHETSLADLAGSIEALA